MTLTDLILFLLSTGHFGLFEAVALAKSTSEQATEAAAEDAP